jgi:hypothetical protein
VFHRYVMDILVNFQSMCDVSHYPWRVKFGRGKENGACDNNRLLLNLKWSMWIWLMRSGVNSRALNSVLCDVKLNLKRRFGCFWKLLGCYPCFQTSAGIFINWTCEVKLALWYFASWIPRSFTVHNITLYYHLKRTRM